MQLLYAKVTSGCVLFLVTLVCGVAPFLILRSSALTVSRRAVGVNGSRVQARLNSLQCLACGVFLATCLLHLLPEAREAISESQLHVAHDLPLTELLAALGFLLLLVVENVILACHSHNHSHAASPSALHQHDDQAVFYSKQTARGRDTLTKSLPSANKFNQIPNTAHVRSHSSEAFGNTDCRPKSEPSRFVPYGVPSPSPLDLRNDAGLGVMFRQMQGSCSDPEQLKEDKRQDKIESLERPDQSESALRPPSYGTVAPFAVSRVCSGQEQSIKTMIVKPRFDTNCYIHKTRKPKTGNVENGTKYDDQAVHNSSLLVAVKGGNEKLHQSDDSISECENSFSSDEDVSLLEKDRKHRVQATHKVEEEQAEMRSQRGQDTASLKSLVLLLALSLHTVFDGLVVGVQETEDGVWTLLAAVSLHKALVAASVALSLVQSHSHHPRTTLVYLTLFSLVAPLGLTVGAALTETSIDTQAQTLTSGVLQSVATGTFMYVTFVESLQGRFEVGTLGRRLVNVVLVLVGFSVVLTVKILLPS
jgi:zinc transporter 1/2/3